MSQSGDDIAWPFAGRIVYALGDDVLNRAWICRRTSAGLRFTPLSAGGLELLDGPRPAAAQRLMQDHRVHTRHHEQPGALLGHVTAPQLTARDGLLLSDYLFRQMPPLVRDLNDASMMELELGRADLHARLLYFGERLRVGAGTLTGLVWPLQPQPAEHAITAATFPMWHWDLATDFAALVTDPAVMLCDLRWTEVRATTAPTETSPPRAPVPSKNQLSEAVEPAPATVSESLDLIEREDQRRRDDDLSQLPPKQAIEWLRNQAPNAPRPAADSIRKRRNRHR